MSYADRHLLVTFRDNQYRYHPGHVTPAFARECRRVHQMGPASLWASWFDGPFEPDQAASLLWACRRQMADKLGSPEFAWSMETIDDMLTTDAIMGNAFTLQFVDFTETPDVPEIEAVTAVDDEGVLEVAPDPEG